MTSNWFLQVCIQSGRYYIDPYATARIEPRRRLGLYLKLQFRLHPVRGKGTSHLSCWAFRNINLTSALHSGHRANKKEELMSRQLPANPNLEHLKKKAKELLSHARQGQSEAVERFRSLRLTGAPKLADAQHVIARDYGFATWAKLKAHISVLTKALTPPEQLSAAVRASDARAVARVLQSHLELKDHLNEPMHDYGGGM